MVKNYKKQVKKEKIQQKKNKKFTRKINCNVNEEKNLLDFDSILEEIFEKKYHEYDEVSNITLMMTTKSWNKINTNKGNLSNY